MQIISFDVGIKNMAYCIFECKENELYVQDWGILNLVSPIENHTCTIQIKGKKPKICEKTAKFSKNNQYFCMTHAKSEASIHSWILPSPSLRSSHLKKKSKEELIEIGNHYHMFESNPKTKKECLEIIETELQKKKLQEIKKRKASANDVNLIEVGINMKKELDKLDLKYIDEVIIENQISKIANRMKTVQGMLTQYFIMQENIPHIEYISSFNKLKDHQSKNKENSYKQHKIDSIVICQEFLKVNSNLSSWSSSLQISKKDDLADAFLQGIWYLKHKNIITYAENLKINCVHLS